MHTGADDTIRVTALLQSLVITAIAHDRQARMYTQINTYV